MTHMLPNDKAAELVIQIITHLADWPIRSTEAFRNALLGTGMFGINPLLDFKQEEQALFLQDAIRRTVAEGRMIDFGFIPNEIIKFESVRSRNMFEAGEFPHPYDSWLAVTSWEGGFNGYYITPNPEWPGATLVVELYGVSIPGGPDVVLVYDIISLHARGKDDTVVMPMNMNYPGDQVQTDAELRGRGANSLDPMVTMLRLLADASIPIISKDAPERLNRSRAKQGKWPIPGHTMVSTKDYVANFFSHGSKGKRPGLGGHHASPIAHWRRSHDRHLSSGKVVTVRSSKINWREATELHRLFYRIAK